MSNHNKKHAYLIMAHNNFSQLQMLVSLLDDSRNDIYLHIDKKSKAFRCEDIHVQHSKLVFIDRIRVNWGGHSQIVCEMNLLRAAAPQHYQYYHLLSGIDLPLKTQDEIHDFFNRSYPNNFIRFDEVANRTGSFLPRISQYHILQDTIGRNAGKFIAVLERLEHYSLLLQNKIGISRKQYIQAYKGTNWFSITDPLVQHILDNEKLIRRQFYYSICADEVFLHSVAMASPYRDHIVNNSLRAIDWKRGTPYTFRQADVEELLSSPNLFGRKFDINIDPNAVDDVVAFLSASSKFNNKTY